MTRRHLAAQGYDAMSIVAIAEEAGTTRQSLYRRWPSKAELATAAIAALAATEAREIGDDHLAELTSELRRFQRGIGRPDGISMVGTMLHRSTDRHLVALYRKRVVAPRRTALLGILERARDAGELAADADLDIGVTMLTGSWYARSLAADTPLPRWAERTATLVWKALGGDVAPTATSSSTGRTVNRADDGATGWPARPARRDGRSRPPAAPA